MSCVDLRVVTFALSALAVASAQAQAPAASALPAAIRGAAPSGPSTPASAPTQKPTANVSMATNAVPAAVSQTKEAPPAREGKADARALPADATIGTITELARQLKVQQLRKELREAGKEQGGPSMGPQSGGESALPFAAKKPVAAVRQPLFAPTVTGIIGSGTNRRVRLALGAELSEGQSITSATLGQSTVVSIGSNFVTFRVCAPAGPAPAPAQAKHKGAAGSVEAVRCEVKEVVPVGL